MGKADGRLAFWLSGEAGTGKTAIAQTTAETAFANGCLGASFFCSRDFEDRSNLRLIFPTLTYQLANVHDDFRSDLVQLVRSDQGVASESLYNQMNRLIVRPLKRFKISTVIVIDAIDECRDDEPVSVFLTVLGLLAPEIPGVKFFLTGRQEPGLEAGLQLPSIREITYVVSLHNIEPSTTNRDIRAFLEHLLSELPKRPDGLDGWPTEDDLNAVCQRAGGLFVYVVAAAKFVGWAGSTPQIRLRQLLDSPEEAGFEGRTEYEPGKTLDSLYLSILQEAYPPNFGLDYKIVRSVLSSVILPTDAFSPSAITTLLNLPAEQVFQTLSVIRPLLILHDDTKVPVRPFHRSFHNLLTDSDRCTNKELYLPGPDCQTNFLENCLRLMERTFVNDPSNTAAGKTLEGKVNGQIDPALDYACKSWYKHLLDADLLTDSQKSMIINILRLFFEKLFLPWLEALSRLGAVRDGIFALDTTIKWLKQVRLFPTLAFAPY